MIRPLPRWLSLAILLLLPTQAAAQVLEFLEAHFNGQDGVTGLAGVVGVTVSPDGKHVYTAAASSSAVAVFARDGATGSLTFVHSLSDGMPGIDGLNSVRGVAVSPDGQHVYTAAAGEDKIGVFARDAVTGELTFVEVQSEPPLDGLDGVFDVDVSPDGSHLYSAAIFDSSVAAFARDALSGELTFVEAEFDGVGGVDGLLSARAVVVGQDGNHVYVAGLTDDAVALFNRNPTTGEVAFVEATFDNVGGVEGLDTPSHLSETADGRHLIVGTQPDFPGDDWLVVFARDETSGQLSFVEAHPSPDPADLPGCPGGPTDPNTTVAPSPDGRFVYATSAPFSTLAVLARDPMTGTLRLREAHCQGVDGVVGMDTPSAVAVSPDGRDVYVVTLFGNSLAAFHRIGIFADGFESGDLSAWSTSVP